MRMHIHTHRYGVAPFDAHIEDEPSAAAIHDPNA